MIFESFGSLDGSSSHSIAISLGCGGQRMNYYLIEKT